MGPSHTQKPSTQITITLVDHYPTNDTDRDFAQQPLTSTEYRQEHIDEKLEETYGALVSMNIISTQYLQMVARRKTHITNQRKLTKKQKQVKENLNNSNSKSSN